MSYKLKRTLSGHENNLYHSLKNVKDLNTNRKVYTMDVSSEMITLLHKQLEALQKLTAHSDSRKHAEERIGEWQLVARVIDRIFFVLFLCIQVGTTVGILVGISTAEKLIPVEEAYANT